MNKYRSDKYASKLASLLNSDAVNHIDNPVKHLETVLSDSENWTYDAIKTSVANTLIFKSCFNVIEQTSIEALSKLTFGTYVRNVVFADKREAILFRITDAMYLLFDVNPRGKARSVYVSRFNPLSVKA